MQTQMVDFIAGQRDLQLARNQTSQPDGSLARSARPTACQCGCSQSRRPAPVAHISVQWRRLRGAIGSTSRLSVAAPPVVPGLAVPPQSPERDCNLSRSLLQLTFPSKYQLWPLAGLELKGSSANLTGPVRCHLAGRETRAGGGCLSTPAPTGSDAKWTVAPFNYPAATGASVLIGRGALAVRGGQQ